jgi:transposase-like protein
MPKKQSPRYDVAIQRRAVEQVVTHQRPIAEVARQLRCSAQSIQRWLKRHRKSFTTSPMKPSSPSPSKASFSRTAFLPLQVEGGEMPSFAETRIEIITPNGLILRLPGETALEVLAGLVRQLEVCYCAGGTAGTPANNACCAGGTKSC